MKEQKIDYKLIIGGLALFIFGMLMGSFGWVLILVGCLGYYAYWQKQQGIK